MRLMGFPNVEKFPEATVSRHPAYIVIVFAGDEGEQTMSMPLKYAGDDPESAELWLLADLKKMGYTVRRETD